ncbi:metaxin-2-like [Anneissia japonica]|uniref:metaxin-2-like n=1 Tax=Anneissia japonica TaxID=1529436 RepID=UPI00142581D7|nr:metaxin-2-like [Anneissia japonica]
MHFFRPSIFLTDVMETQREGEQNVPQHVDIFQPLEETQILLPEQAQCLAVKALLHMCGINFTVKEKQNAEQMSPSGELPFIKTDEVIISEFDSIVEFLAARGKSLSADLSADQKAELQAYLTLTTNRLYMAKLFLSWNVKENASAISRPRYGSPHKWPLNHVLAWSKQAKVYKKLRVSGWSSKTKEQVYDDIHNCCRSLSDRVGDQYYFFMDQVTELDALVYGHLKSMLTTAVDEGQLAVVVKGYPRLTRFCKRIDERYFS